MVKLTLTGVKINTNLVWTSHNTGGVEFNTGVFAVNVSNKFRLLVHSSSFCGWGLLFMIMVGQL